MAKKTRISREEGASLPARRTVLRGAAGLVGLATVAPRTAGTVHAASAGAVLGPTSEIPLGGGKVYRKQKVVVTQPSADDYKGFTAVCTHEGCIADNVLGGTINCGCHGSKFSITDGSVDRGPARRSLAPRDISVSDGNITLT